jgi:hypothetical protein
VPDLVAPWVRSCQVSSRQERTRSRSRSASRATVAASSSRGDRGGGRNRHPDLLRLLREQGRHPVPRQRRAGADLGLVGFLPRRTGRP